MTSKESAKKVCCTCKVVVLLIKPIALLTFSLLSPSSILRSSFADEERHSFSVLWLFLALRFHCICSVSFLEFLFVCLLVVFVACFVVVAVVVFFFQNVRAYYLQFCLLSQYSSEMIQQCIKIIITRSYN